MAPGPNYPFLWYNMNNLNDVGVPVSGHSLKQFQDAVTRLGGGRADGLHAKLVAAWSMRPPGYHVLQHLDEGLVRVVRWGAPRLSPTDLAILVLAWWFHDAVYDTHSSMNEAMSAALAELELASLGIPLHYCARVAQLVVATDHRTPVAPGDLVTDLLLDIDLAILGAPSERFAEYEAQVAVEYGWVQPDAYAEGRAKVLAHFRALAFAEPPTLYRTEAGRTLLAQARINLAQGATDDHKPRTV